jgi:glycosyltransferase involved in cell wall biosynthesis
MKVNIIHIIPGMKMGGAEKALLRLIINSPKCNHHVLSLTRGGAMHEVFLKNNISVKVFDFDKSFFLSFRGVISFMLDQKPDVVQTWLYSANIIGGIAAKISRVDNIIWGLRGTGIPQSFFSLHMIMIIFGAFLSYFIPNKIVSNAKSVMDFHIKNGYKKSNHVVIPNGFDINKYTSHSSFHKLSDIGIDEKKQSIIIGTVGRYDRLKDYKTMIKACSLAMIKNSNIRILMVGRGLEESNSELMRIFFKNRIDLSKISLVGEVNNVRPYIDMMDIFCLSSKNEGFPNVVCEAMLMSKPCVVTDCGDSSDIVSNTGIVVPIEDHQKLSMGLMKMINIGKEGRKKFGQDAFIRASTHFSIEKNVEKFSKLYLQT